MANQLYFFLVDDDEDDVTLFGDMITSVSPGIRYGYAYDGVSAVRQLKKDPQLPSVIFLDFNMPKKSGIECLKELKNITRLKNIPVIMYSTLSYESQIETAIQQGATCFIAKPSSIERIKKIIVTLAGNMPGNLNNALQELDEANACVVY